MTQVVIPSKGVPAEWRIESIDNDGAVKVTLFSGPDAEARARSVAEWLDERRFYPGTAFEHHEHTAVVSDDTYKAIADDCMDVYDTLFENYKRALSVARYWLRKIDVSKLDITDAKLWSDQIEEVAHALRDIKRAEQEEQPQYD